MAQIKGVINQAHRNNELEQIKQMYNSETTILLNDNEKENGTEQESELDSEEEEEDDQIITNNETSQSFDRILNLWNLMLEDEFLDDNLENGENSLATESFLNNVNLETFMSEIGRAHV